MMTRAFKSGNSVAVRLPKQLGLEPGTEVEVRHDKEGNILIIRAVPEAVTLDQLFGSFSPGFMAHGRGEIEQAERRWAESPGAADG